MEPEGVRGAALFAGEAAAADAERILFAESLADAEVEEILARYGFADPAKADSKIQELAGAPATRRVLGRLLPVLLETLARSAAPDRTLVNLKRLADGYAGRETLYSILADDPQALANLVTVFGASQFFADTVVRWPSLLVLFFDRERLLAPKKRRRLRAELAEVLSPLATDEGALDALRAFKRRELLRIGVRDITGRTDLLTTTAELSDLADVCIEAGYGLATRAAAQLQPDIPEGWRFAVLAMGKLGGKELNYSSDIDLMFVCDPGLGGDPDGAAQAYYSRLAEILVGALAEHTGEGHVFRVDTALRPEGRDGPLVRSLESYRAYYERWAAMWEFQALLKCRFVAGDSALGAEFEAMVEPLVYRDVLLPDEVERIRALKQRTERLVEASGEFYREVKLGFGGIRDIEFTVQLLQLAYGRGQPRLRGGNTIRALGALRGLGIITSQEHDEITASYVFLRDTEHRLQIMQSLQQHALPADKAKLADFARRAGYAEGVPGPEERFETDYLAHTGRVRAFMKKYFMDATYDGGVVTLASFVASPATSEHASEILAPYGMKDVGRAARNIDALVNAAGGADAGFVAWIEGVLSVAAQTPDPDAALLYLSQFVFAMGGGQQTIRMLADGRFVLDLLLRMFGTSEFFAGELVRHPEFLDVLASPTATFADKDYADLVAEIRQATGPARTYGEKLDELRRYKRRELLRIGARDLVGGADVRTVSEELTRLADACLREGYVLTEGRLAAECGLPERSSFAVIGLGRLGSRELNYSSDLDVVFVYRGEGALPDGTTHTVFWTRLAEGLMRALSAPSALGAAYEIDPNLRPEGRNGPLVRSLDSYREYYESWAQIWEFQALIRARPICGDIELAGDFMQMLQHLIYRERLADDDLAEIRRLKRRMETERLGKGPDRARNVKLGPGGISDVEFAVQVLQLKHGRRVRSVRRADTFEAIRQLAKNDLLAPEDAKVFTRGLALLRRIELRLQIVRKRPEHVIPTDPVELGVLARRLGYQGDVTAAGKVFFDDYLRTTSAVRAVFERLVGA